MDQIIGGRYQLEPNEYNIIGVGGMGTVFVGTDTVTRQQVAIKQLRPEILLEQPEMLARFKREAEALSRLNHPHIVKVLDTVEEDPYSYIIMEYMSKGSLRDLITTEEQMSVKRVLEVALDLSDALIRAHRLKILHRDIKPANVLIAQDGSPRLTDFGVARLEDEPGVTRTGTVIGTLSYLSPEALNGFELDERSDIWAFGVMMYEMLTGKLPFESNTMTGLITAILTKPVPFIGEYRNDIPPALSALIDNMLQKDLEQRIDSMRQIGAELERIMRGDTDTPGAVNITWSAPLEGVVDDLATEQFDLKPQVINRDTQTVDDARASQQYRQSQVLQRQGDETAFNRGNTPATKRSSQWVYGVGVLLVVAITMIVIVLGNTQTTPTVTLPDIPASQYPVLVANFGVREDSVALARLVRDGLRKTFEQEWLYSNIRVVALDEAITSAEGALAFAEQYDTPLIIWGQETANGVDVMLQLGSLGRYPQMPFDRNILARMVDLDLPLQNASDVAIASDVVIASYVASAFATLAAADGDVYEWARLVAVVHDLDVTPETLIENNNLATILHNFNVYYHNQGDLALATIDRAVNIDVSNALFYWLRAMQFNRQQIIEHIQTGGEGATISTIADSVRRNQQSAIRLAPEGWVAPLYSQFEGGNSGGTRSQIQLVNTTADIESAIATRPDLWAPLYLFSEISQQAGDSAQAKDAIDRAMALAPDVSVPYTSAIMLALREGDILVASEQVDLIVRQLPNPLTTQRIFDTFFGVPTPEGALPTIFNNLIIGQYPQTLSIAQEFLTGNNSEGLFSNTNSMLLIASIAQCNLGEFDRARFGLNSLVASESDFMFARLVRADVNLSNAGADRAQNDFERILESDQATVLAPFVEAVRANTYGCDNLFDLEVARTISATTVAEN